ncbi:MAG: hypothetical protein MHM6MM_004296 [Cercozoa sp. M6MM]
MSHYDNDPRAQRTRDIEADIDHVKGRMVENIDLAMQRGEQLEVLEAKSQTLENDADQYRKGSRQVRRTYCIRKWRNICILVFLLALLILILYFILK